MGMISSLPMHIL